MQYTSYVTPIGIAKLAFLNKPSYKFKEEGEYIVELVLPKEDSEKLIQKIEESAQEYYTNHLPNKQLPKEAFPYRLYIDEEGKETGEYIFKFKLKAFVQPKNPEKQPYPQKPVLFDAKCRPINSEIWSGSRIKVHFKIHPWHRSKWGISLWVYAVQVLDVVNSESNTKPMSAKEFGFKEEEGYVAPLEHVTLDESQAPPF